MRWGGIDDEEDEGEEDPEDMARRLSCGMEEEEISMRLSCGMEKDE